MNYWKAKRAWDNFWRYNAGGLALLILVSILGGIGFGLGVKLVEVVWGA